MPSPNPTAPLRVALVGCGKIADQHVAAIARIAGSDIVALCDREILMAEQLGERAGISSCYSDASQMLVEAKPDVVHITTPPTSHHALARQCLEAGCHVYVEKPFTITAREAVELVDLARTRSLRITAGHNYQFTPEMLDMRRLVKDGILGGRPIHLESHWPYDLGDRVYVSAMLGDPNHWVRKLPGQLFHNLISHGIAKLAEFLDDDIVEISASAFQSDALKNLGGGDVNDELRVRIRDAKGTSAYFTFSTQIRPARNQLLICGPENSLTIDGQSGSLVKHRNWPAKSYLTFFVPPVCQGFQYFRNGPRNIIRFLKRDLYHDAGMKGLIHQFHTAVAAGPGAPDPIPMREILLTAKIMDEIFAQVYGAQQTEAPKAERDELSAVRCS